MGLYVTPEVRHMYLYMYMYPSCALATCTELVTGNIDDSVCY